MAETERVRKHPFAQCEKCPLYERPYVPDAPIEGAELIMVGEAPGEQEVQKKTPFVGPSGQLLATLIRQNQRNPAKVSRHNVVACRPPENRTPTEQEIACCAPRVLHEIKLQDCKTVVALGKTPSELFLELMGQDKLMKLSDRRGRWFKWPELGIDWLSTWHPAYVLRVPGESKALKYDIGKAYQGPQDGEAQKEPQVIHVTTYEDLVKVVSRIPDGAKVAFDIETDQVNWYDRPTYAKDSIIALGFAWKYHFGVAIHPDLLYEDERAVPLLNAAVKKWKLRAHNGKFDTIFLRTGINLQIPLDFDFDTMLAHYALDENEMHGLKGIAQTRYGIPNYEALIISQYLRSSNDYYSKIPYDKLCLYMIWDVCVTLRLADDFERELKAVPVKAMGGSTLYEWPFKNVLMPAQAALAKVEIEGVEVDDAYMRAWLGRLEKERELYQREFCDLIGRDINLNSAPQKAALFYDEMRLPDPAQTRARGIKPRSTAQPAMAIVRELLKQQGEVDPFVMKVLDKLGQYQRVQKIISSYVVNILDFQGTDRKTHPSYKVMGTETGRLSAVDPAIQTIPRPDDRYGAICRSAFIAGKGKKFIIADYSQGELRAAAHLSQDPFLLKVYADGRDLHSEVARAMFGSNFTKHQRVLCKMFNFSYLYGGNEHSFAEGAGLPIEVARGFVRDYNKVMPKLAAWKDAQYAFARKFGYVESLTGRRRRFPVITNANKEDVRKASVNMPVQSIMSDMNLIAGVRLVERGFDLAILVHDSLILRCDEDFAPQLGKITQEVMVNTAAEFMPSVVWEADADIDDRWCPTPADYVKAYATNPKKREDDDELRKLAKWTSGEPTAVQFILDAIAEPCTSARGDLLMKASKELEVL